MSIIGIDASRANVRQRTGTERFAFHVIQELKKIIPAEHRVVLYSPEPLRDGLEVLPPNWESRVLNWPPRHLWTQLRLSWEMRKRPPDVLFVAAHALPFVLPKRSVTVIHDVGFVENPQWYGAIERQYHLWSTRLALKRADRILTVSEFSKSEIVRHCGADPSRIAVAHLACDPEQFHDVVHSHRIREVARTYGVLRRAPYFLYVGRLESKKNLAGLIAAFVKFSEGRDQDIYLLLAGKKGRGFEAAMAQVRGKKISRQIIVPGYVSREHLPYLYAGARALVFPTWYEGFGIPVLEAWACKTPVIASAVASLPEVAGEAALYVDPRKPETIAAAMSRIMDERGLDEKMTELGLARLHKYSWPATARKIWQTIKPLL